METLLPKLAADTPIVALCMFVVWLFAKYQAAYTQERVQREQTIAEKWIEREKAIAAQACDDRDMLLKVVHENTVAMTELKDAVGSLRSLVSSKDKSSHKVADGSVQSGAGKYAGRAVGI